MASCSGELTCQAELKQVEQLVVILVILSLVLLTLTSNTTLLRMIQLPDLMQQRGIASGLKVETAREVV